MSFDMPLDRLAEHVVDLKRSIGLNGPEVPNGTAKEAPNGRAAPVQPPPYVLSPTAKGSGAHDPATFVANGDDAAVGHAARLCEAYRARGNHRRRR